MGFPVVHYTMTESNTRLERETPFLGGGLLNCHDHSSNPCGYSPMT